MSVIQQHTSSSLTDAWRTINIDILTEESSQNFDLSTLRPDTGSDSSSSPSEAQVRQLATQVRQLLRGGDAEGALRGCLERPVYGSSAAAGVAVATGSREDESAAAKDAHLATVLEVLQGIKASEMTPMLQRIYGGEGGAELLDVLMKYLYKGMASSAGASGGSSIGQRTPTKMTPQQTGFSQVSGRPGAPNESSGAAMSVLLSWHEKVVDVAGLGCIGRTMTDWRRV